MRWNLTFVNKGAKNIAISELTKSASGRSKDVQVLRAECEVVVPIESQNSFVTWEGSTRGWGDQPCVTDLLVQDSVKNDANRTFPNIF